MMTTHVMLITGLLVLALLDPSMAWAAERECDRWLKLVDYEVQERKEVLGKKTGAARAKI